jgi:hypothetical protein
LKANSFVSTATTQGSSTITAPHAEETAAPARTLDHLIDELPQMPFPMQRGIYRLRAASLNSASRRQAIICALTPARLFGNKNDAADAADSLSKTQHHAPPHRRVLP